MKLEIVPAVFPVGYSNDLLWHDPNLIEALPVRDAPIVVRDGVARLESDSALALKGGDFSDLKKWDWKDDNVVADNGAALYWRTGGTPDAWKVAVGRASEPPAAWQVFDLSMTAFLAGWLAGEIAWLVEPETTAQQRLRKVQAVGGADEQEREGAGRWLLAHPI